jgi:MFS family permease
LFAILFLALGIGLSGWLSDRFNPRAVLIGGSFAGMAAGLAMAPLLGLGLGGLALFLSLALFAMGFVYGPLGAWLPGLFPARVRYTGTSLAFNVGGIIGGGLTPVVAQALADGFGLWAVGLWVATACAVSAATLLIFARA